MNRTKVILGLYGSILGLFLILMLFLSLKSDPYLKQERKFISLTTISDPALYSDVYGIRFYSLVLPEELYDDPILPLHSKSGFIYKVGR